MFTILMENPSSIPDSYLHSTKPVIIPILRKNHILGMGDSAAG
jgi:hypothetical protein